MRVRTHVLRFRGGARDGNNNLYVQKANMGHGRDEKEKDNRGGAGREGVGWRAGWR